MPEAGIVLAGLGVFAVGLVAGLGIRMRNGQRLARERALEAELSEERDAFAGYREQVRKHMDQTSHLFRDLTNQHAALYHHLAGAARELAPSSDQLTGQAFGKGLIDLGSDAKPPETEQLAEPAMPRPEGSESASGSASGSDSDSDSDSDSGSDSGSESEEPVPAKPAATESPPAP